MSKKPLRNNFSSGESYSIKTCIDYLYTQGNIDFDDTLFLEKVNPAQLAENLMLIPSSTTLSSASFSFAYNKLAREVFIKNIIPETKDFIRENLGIAPSFSWDDHSSVYNLETVFDDFYLTSKETDFSKYKKEIEIKDYKDAKTKDTKIKHVIEYTIAAKGKKIKKKEEGLIIASLQSPLNWLNKNLELNLTNDTTEEEVIQKIEATGFLNIKTEQEIIYNAICALLRAKSFKEKKDNGIFISFNELHKQLGYKSDLRTKDIEKFKDVIYELSNLYVNINMDKCVYTKHKQYAKLHGNIEKEPLVIYTGFCRAKAKINNTAKIVHGFKTNLTGLMKLHFDFTKLYHTSDKLELQDSNINKRKSKLEHAPKLELYIKRLFHVNIGNQNYCIDLKIDTIFSKLKEFSLEDDYKKSKRKTEFIQRKILNPINKLAYEVKKAEILDSKIRIYFNKCK